MPATRKRLRVQAAYRDPYHTPSNLLLTGTDKTVQLGRGEDVELEVAILDADEALFDLANMATVTLELKSLVRGQYAPAETATPLVKVVIASADFTAATFANWIAGTAEQLRFTITAAQSANCPAGQVWLAIYGTSGDDPGRHVNFLAGKINIVEDGVPSGVDPETVDPDAYDKAESDARFALKAPADSNYRISADGQLQLYNVTSAEWHDLFLEDINGVPVLRIANVGEA